VPRRAPGMGGLPRRACREGPCGRGGRSASQEEDQGASVNDGRFDPLKIVQAFNHRSVEHVVIGGYAGLLHAARALRPATSTSRPAPQPRTSVGSRRSSLISMPASAPRGTRRSPLFPGRCITCQRLAHGTSPASSVSSTSASSQSGLTAMRTWCAQPSTARHVRSCLSCMLQLETLPHSDQAARVWPVEPFRRHKTTPFCAAFG